MIRRYLSILSLCVLTLVSCSKEDELNLPVGNEDKVVLLTQIASVASDSRADVGIDGKGHFVDGDAITLYVNQNQREVQMQDGDWTPALSWDEIGGVSASFKAFYPNVNNNNWTFKHVVDNSQHIGNHFEKSDLLYASEVTVNRGNPVNLNFKHLMSCMTVELRSNVFTSEQLENAVVKVKAYNAIDVNADGTLGKLYDWRARADISVIQLKHQGNGIFQAVICPQTVNEVDYGYDGWISIKIAGREFNKKEAPQEFKGFKSGENTTFTYSFNTDEPDPVWGNKTFWVDGVKNIPDSSSDEWKLISYVSKLKHLPWKAEYGWFDCSKKDTNSSKYNDMNKCWAATASNLIHWWLDRNDKYIKLYCKEKNVASLSDLKVPHVYKDHHETEVFQAFRDRFTDEGSFARDGMKWYFLGKYKNETGRSQLINPDVASGGYFKDVLDENSAMSVNTFISDMPTLTATLKKAFKEKKGIAFSVFLKGFGSGHAMTIWGAKFDVYGNVAAIYYVDNNDGTLGQEHIGLIEARVGDYDGKDTSLKGRACLENWEGKLAIQIQNVDLLDLREEAWKKYLGL